MQYLFNNSFSSIGLYMLCQSVSVFIKTGKATVSKLGYISSRFLNARPFL